MQCPRCQGNLDASEFDGVPMHMCEGCLGALVAQRDLIRLLDAMSAALAETMSFDHPIEPVVDHAGDAACPKCGVPMETFGYMESNLVYADRCRSCWVIWTDPEEIGVMAVIYARTNHRTGTLQAERDAWQTGLAKRVGLALVQRARGGGGI